jgi:hypothetical protein
MTQALYAHMNKKKKRRAPEKEPLLFKQLSPPDTIHPSIHCLSSKAD